MKRTMQWMGAALALMALPGAALAQRGAPRPPPATEDRGLLRDITVMGQAGVLTYTGEAAARTTPGATYGVLLGADVLRWVGAEVSYQGAVYQTEGDISPVGDQFRILENGGQAIAKVGPNMGRLEPFALGGVAITRLNVVGEPIDVPVEDATIFKLPVGAGVDWKLQERGQGGALTLGARAVYNFGLDAGAFPGLGPASTNQFMGTLHLGGSF